MKSLATAFFILIVAAPLNAQNSVGFTPSTYLDTIPRPLRDIFEARYAKEAKGIQSKYKVEVRQAYRAQFDEAIRQFNSDRMMVESEISDYLMHIVERIAKANGFSAEEINIYGFRSDVPNAACYGNGILSVMVGLLARLETEDEVAWIVSHELAHHLAKDNLRGTEKAIDILHDKQARRDLSNTRWSEYNRYTKTKDILGRLDARYLQHSRVHEEAADSAGLVMFLKTGYDAGFALKALEVLRQAENDPYDSLDLKAFLTDNGIKFEPSWLQYSGHRWHKDRAKPDSLLTHPNITQRTIGVARLLHDLGYSYDSLNAPRNVRKNIYKYRAELEMVEGEFHFKEYSRALYHSIQLSKVYPDNAWLRAMIGRCFYEIYTRQKNHTLGTSVDMPHPGYADSYNRLITFVHKLRLTEMEYVAYRYMTSQPEEFYTNEDFIYSLWLTSSLKISQLDPDKVRADYDALYPNGEYKWLMRK